MSFTIPKIDRYCSGTSLSTRTFMDEVVTMLQVRYGILAKINYQTMRVLEKNVTIDEMREHWGQYYIQDENSKDKSGAPTYTLVKMAELDNLYTRVKHFDEPITFCRYRVKKFYDLEVQMPRRHNWAHQEQAKKEMHIKELKHEQKYRQERGMYELEVYDEDGSTYTKEGTQYALDILTYTNQVLDAIDAYRASILKLTSA